MKVLKAGDQMRTGKLAEPVLRRSVLRQMDMCRADGRGAPCAALAGESGRVSAYATVNAAPGYYDEPSVLVTAAANALAACGAVPEAFTVSAVLPADYEEASLKKDMRRMAETASDAGMQALGGHTQVSADVLSPQYTLNGIGGASAEEYRGDTVLLPGQELVLTKWIALAGTAAMARHFQEELEHRFPVLLIDRAKELRALLSVAAEARAATHFGTCAMHALSQGGIFGALWEMAERSGCGLEVDLKKIPVKQETIEICEYFDINPYYLYSAGALLIGTDRGQELVSELERQGIPAAVIGRAKSGKDRIIRNGEDIRFLDRPQQEEWYRRFEK